MLRAEALTIPHWKKTMKEELKALEISLTWEIVQLPLMKKPVGCRCIFAIKYYRMEVYKDEKQDD